jgi:hypothetical protein
MLILFNGCGYRYVDRAALDPNYQEMAKTDSDFDRIRDDQRFQELLKE